MLLELAEEIGLKPKKVSSTNGGEYMSPCPECGGCDRFRIWPSQNENGRYWCRKCLRTGDAIQFCREFKKMPYQEALLRVGCEIPVKRFSHIKNEFTPKEVIEPNFLWIKRATHFVEKTHETLLRQPSLIEMDKNRGLSEDSIKKYKLGFNATQSFEMCKFWGMEATDSKKLCLPKGIVIPAFRQQKLIGLKIRRVGWTCEEKYPKYQIVNGGGTCASIYGNLSSVVILIEAQLDAMLVHQVAEDLCCCVALGGVSNKPDKYLHAALLKAPLILYALDFDDAGKAKFQFWRANYPNLRAWPVPRGKSPGDAFLLGVDLRDWVKEGIKLNQRNEVYGKE